MMDFVRKNYTQVVDELNRAGFRTPMDGEFQARLAKSYIRLIKRQRVEIAT
jgi:uncharacterized membrane protein YukC